MKFTKKVREQEDVYIKKKLDKKRALQVAINNGNIIVYMAAKDKDCGMPSPSCYDAVGNSHKNFWFEPKNDQNL